MSALVSLSGIGLFGTNEGFAIGVVNGRRELKSKMVFGDDAGAPQKPTIRDRPEAGAIPTLRLPSKTEPRRSIPGGWTRQSPRPDPRTRASTR